MKGRLQALPKRCGPSATEAAGAAMHIMSGQGGPAAIAYEAIILLRRVRIPAVQWGRAETDRVIHG